MPKFKFGDKVIVNGVKGAVVSLWIDLSGDYIYRVRVNNSLDVEYPENHLRPDKPKVKFMVGGQMVANAYGFARNNPEVNCPICKERWKIQEHPIHGSKELWYDCIKCSKTREQIEEELNDEF